LLRYVGKASGLSRQQAARLAARFLAGGPLEDRRGKPARPFPRRYTQADILALAEMGALHGTLPGPAAKKLCERAFRLFGDARHERLAGISNGHLYNLRRSAAYRRQRAGLDKTRPAKVAIGERRKPRPQGQPGCLRVDSVHPGDLDGVKGLYLVNAVDEVTQFQFVAAVERISERFLLPVLERLILHPVVKLLNKLHVEEFTCVPRPPQQRQRPGGRQERARPCASTSATPTSRPATPGRSTTSPWRSSRPASTSTGPASFPRRPSTTKAASPSATALALRLNRANREWGDYWRGVEKEAA
jgi:hypothetical protein